MTWPVTLPEKPTGPGLPEQGLTACEACRAINLPGSNYCCACGLPLPGGALDAEARAEVEELVRQARAAAGGGPVWAEAGQNFRARVVAGTVSLWPAAVASPHFLSDPWSGLGQLDNARVLLVERLDCPIAGLLPLLESVAAGQQGLVIVAGAISGEILTTLTVNQLQGTFRSLPLVLTLPGATHPAILADIAAMLRGKVIAEKAVAKTKAAALPTIASVLGNESRAWAVGITPPPVPALSGEPAVVAARRGIYEHPAARIELGAGTITAIEIRRRYACRVLRAAPATTRDTGLVAAPSSDIREE